MAAQPEAEVNRVMAEKKPVAVWVFIFHTDASRLWEKEGMRNPTGGDGSDIRQDSDNSDK